MSDKLSAIPGLLLVACCAAGLGGCSVVDSGQTWAPGFLRAEAAARPTVDPPPDIHALLRGRLNQVFAEGAQPTGVRVSQPRRDLSGNGWIACVRADVMSAMGRPLSGQTYAITTVNGAILDRRPAGASDNCSSESYAPL